MRRLDSIFVKFGAGIKTNRDAVVIGFDDGTEKNRSLNGQVAPAIHSNLSATTADTTTAMPLRENSDIAYMGDTKGGAFDITEAQALEMLHQPNPHGKPNSDVIVPWVNGLDVTRRPRSMFILDFGFTRTEEDCAKYQTPFAFVSEKIRPERVKNNRALYARYWWRHVEPRPGMLTALAKIPRFLTTIAVAKHRLFVWMESPTLPDHSLFAFARADNYFLGLVQSRFHEVWALKQGTRLETRPRYTPTTCFETFAFPFADDLEKPLDNLEAEMNAAKFYAHIVLREEPPPYQAGSRRREKADSPASDAVRLVTSAATKEEHRAAIAAAAKELNELRERWLNPPEWTVEKILEFPGSIGGVWDRYINKSKIENPKSQIGLVRYPRLEPRDADCAAKLKARTLTKLYNERPAWLDLAHKKLDAAVAAAYGWPADLTDENILEKLLALNLARAAEEAKTAKGKKPKATREKHADEMI